MLVPKYSVFLTIFHMKLVYIPSRELTYPFPKTVLNRWFSISPGGDMLVSWRVSLIRFFFVSLRQDEAEEIWDWTLEGDSSEGSTHQQLGFHEKTLGCLDCNWDFHMQCWESVQAGESGTKFRSFKQFGLYRWIFRPISGFHTKLVGGFRTFFYFDHPNLWVSWSNLTCPHICFNWIVWNHQLERICLKLARGFDDGLSRWRAWANYLDEFLAVSSSWMLGLVCFFFSLSWRKAKWRLGNWVENTNQFMCSYIWYLICMVHTQGPFCDDLLKSKTWSEILGLASARCAVFWVFSFLRISTGHQVLQRTWFFSSACCFLIFAYIVSTLTQWRISWIVVIWRD